MLALSAVAVSLAHTTAVVVEGTGTQSKMARIGILEQAACRSLVHITWPSSRTAGGARGSLSRARYASVCLLVALLGRAAFLYASVAA